MTCITVRADNILSLIEVAEDCGYNRHVLFDGFAIMFDWEVSDYVIENYIDTLTEESEEEDLTNRKEKARKTLYTWRNTYCPNTQEA